MVLRKPVVVLKIKVLFVSSGNSKSGISPIIKNQGESLSKVGVDITYYTIKGKGFRGYLNNVKLLRLFLKDNDFDIIHAHYSISAFVASLASAKPLIVSLMGSDVKSKKYYKLIIRLFNYFTWAAIIVKSQDMKSSLGIDDAFIIPNGIDMDKFKPLNKEESKKKLGWNTFKQQVLFAANPKRYEKNFNLAESAFELLNNDQIELKVLKEVPNELMPIYHNAADVVLLTSLWEGSPNVIKEALACNIPVVSTDVGDVKKVFGHMEGCYLTTFEPKDVADKIKKALTFSENEGLTQGREWLMELGLDAESVARKLMLVYSKVLWRNA